MGLRQPDPKPLPTLLRWAHRSRPRRHQLRLEHTNPDQRLEGNLLGQRGVHNLVVGTALAIPISLGADVTLPTSKPSLWQEGTPRPMLSQRSASYQESMLATFALSAENGLCRHSADQLQKGYKCSTVLCGKRNINTATNIWVQKSEICTNPSCSA